MAEFRNLQPKPSSLALPTELLYEIISRVLSHGLHQEMLVESQLERQGPNISLSLARVCRRFLALVISLLSETFSIPKIWRNDIDSLHVILKCIQSHRLVENGETIAPLFFLAYEEYLEGIRVGRRSYMIFNPVEANLRTWAVEERQLSPGIYPLTVALSFARNISPRTMGVEIESSILRELANQLAVRQFQVWRWCLIKAFYLLPISPGENHEVLDLAISRLLDRIEKCEQMTPKDLGYNIPHLPPLPPETVQYMNHIPKATPDNIEKSKLGSSILQLSQWEDDIPGYYSPWRSTMRRILERWELVEE